MKAFRKRPINRLNFSSFRARWAKNRGIPPVVPLTRPDDRPRQSALVRQGGDAYQRGAMPVLFLIVFVDLVGFGLIIPLLPFYAERFGASPQLVTILLA